MNEDDVRAPKEGPIVNAPNNIPCTLGALNENTADSVRIERRRVHGTGFTSRFLGAPNHFASFCFLKRPYRPLFLHPGTRWPLGARRAGGKNHGRGDFVVAVRSAAGR